ncbi:MAG: hypothetical protein K2G66_02630, partial [Alistipes sp.]|nr:hypothetical protein [Alistipes sp.]
DRIQDSGSYDMGSIPVGTTSGTGIATSDACVLLFFRARRTTERRNALPRKNNNKFLAGNKK